MHQYEVRYVPTILSRDDLEFFKTKWFTKQLISNIYPDFSSYEVALCRELAIGM